MGASKQNNRLKPVLIKTVNVFISWLHYGLEDRLAMLTDIRPMSCITSFSTRSAAVAEKADRTEFDVR